MIFFPNIRRLISRMIHSAKAARHCWKTGENTQKNIIQVTIGQINYGGILKGKRVLITGGSAGIGLAIAKKCLSEGATVVITGRSEDKLRNAKTILHNPNLKTLTWDVSQVDLNDKKLEEALQLAGGSLDILVNNAGILAGGLQFLDLTEELWDKISSVNAKGLVFLTQHIVKNWIQRKQCGKIINMSSMRGALGVSDGPYGMSKWAVNGLTSGLGLKLAPHGIIVNGIAPGITATESISIKNIDVKENAYLNGVPVSRIGLPEEIAELAVFLMSDAANYIVGQTIVCDGGYTLKI